MNRQIFARAAASALLAAGLFTATVPSHAFRMAGAPGPGCVVPFQHLANNAVPVNWFHNTALQGAGKGSALTAAMSSWTNVPAANHTLIYSGVTLLGFATDGQNTISWGTAGCTGSCLAITAQSIVGALVIAESDILFNNAQTWTVNGANFDTQTVATHELGHSLGIAHTNLVGAPQATMSAAYFGPNGRTLEADDRMALQCAEAMY